MNQGNGMQVAPHGILMFAALCLGVVLLVHALGFAVVAAVRVGR